MNLIYEKVTAKAPELFAQLICQPRFLINSKVIPPKPAIYVFYFENTPVHVGRTRNLRQRLSGHVSNSHYSASFAFKRARHATQISATYKKGEGRGALLQDSIFKAAFDKALVEVRGMEVQYLEIADDLDQYLLELYAALELNTSLTEFGTH